MLRQLSAVAALAATLASSAPAAAQCVPEWSRDFCPPGANGPVLAMAAFEQDAGPALVAAGDFNQAGGLPVSQAALWDGSHWSRMGTHLNDTVRALAVFDDDGNGPDIGMVFAGGDFMDGVERWDGAEWVPLGAGVNGPVRALIGFDDGSGPALYAAGDFTQAGGNAAAHIARWDGAAWHPLGAGLGDNVYALAVYDDGAGPALYAGGTFTTAGGKPASRIARWDGAGWAALGSGTSGPVAALAVYDDGTGSGLYAGGLFNTAGGQSASRIARWRAGAWSALGSGVNDSVYALTAYNDGSGAALYVGGQFTSAGGNAASRLARWNGAWSGVGAGATDVVRALAGADIRGRALFTGGDFITAGDGAANYIGQWRDARWSGLGEGIDSNADALASVDLGNGPALYVGGSFSNVGGIAAHAIAAWSGSQWDPLGSGVDGYINAIIGFDDGSGMAVYVGGSFQTAGGQSASNMARWSGSQWSPVGNWNKGIPYAFVVFDDGGGSALYAGGGFGVYKWDGTEWSPVGGATDASIRSLGVFDDGAGDALYAGGGFSKIGGVSANNVAKWNGSAWSKLGGGADNEVYALRNADLGTGPALYAGGAFQNVDGLPASAIARWNGLSWSTLSTGMSNNNGPPVVFSLLGLDLGDGQALYASGWFSTAGGVPASNIARWDAAFFWSDLGTGLSDQAFALGMLDTGDGPALFAAGSLNSAGAFPSSHIARWSCPPPAPPLNPCESAELFAPGGGPSDFLGQSISISGDTLFAGAFGDDRAGIDAGAAQVFMRQDGQWAFFQTLLAADAAPGDFFGASLSSSGNAAIIGAPRADPAGASSGAAYIFRFADGAWTQEARLVPDDAAAGDQFGFSVAILGDTALVGAWKADLPNKPNAGAAYIFTRQGGQWTQAAKLRASDAASEDQFGAAAALSDAYAYVGAPADDNFAGIDAGAVYFFLPGQWTQSAKSVPKDLEAGDRFGSSIAAEGPYAFFGAPGSDIAAADAGAVYIFRYGLKNAVLTLSGAQPGDAAGTSVAVRGGLALIGARTSDLQGTDSGAAALFGLAGDAWSELATLPGTSIQPGDLLGQSVAIGPGTLAAGAIHAAGPGGQEQGAVLVYSTTGCLCYPDFNSDQTLDLFDFLAFVNAFNAADPPADCDHSGALDLFDFLCFANAFNAGCP